MKSYQIGLIILLATWESGAAANIVNCGSSEGRGLYAKSKLLQGNSEADKWIDDRISNGKISLVRGPDGSLDVLFSDARDTVQSAKSAGAVVVEVGRSDRALAILVSYPGALVETYTFFVRADGKHEVLWTATKYGSVIDSVKAMRANCNWIGNVRDVGRR
jgi:hypothetical protein